MPQHIHFIKICTFNAEPFRSGESLK